MFRIKLIIILILLNLSCFSQNLIVEDTTGVDEILIEFIGDRDDNIINSVGKLKKEIGTKTMKKFSKSKIHVVKVKNVDDALKKLKGNKKVKWSSPNYKITHNLYPNDYYWTQNQLWGLKNIGADKVWQTNRGNSNVIVGVIDQGIMYWHEDLCGQIWTNPYDTVDGIDNDGNGYIDDIHGWDFKNGDNTIFDGSDNHGTHVAGTIGAKGDNSVGVVGVSPNVTIISAKFLETFGLTSDAIEAIDYITDLKIRHGLNIVCTNNSWGGGGYSQGIFDAIERAKMADILFVAAAGNSTTNNDLSPSYPASYNNENIISVASITSTDQLSSFSNFGEKSVDIAAPGSGIVSSIPSSNIKSTYTFYNGTSMATPHVSGSIALYKAANPNANYSQIKSAILSNVRPVVGLQGKILTGGVLNISNFTNLVPFQNLSRSCAIPAIDTTGPIAPKNFRILELGKNKITLIWNKTIDPQSSVKSYEIYSIREDDKSRIYTTYVSDTTGSIINLAQQIWVKCWVRARNSWNILGPPSDTIFTTTLGIRDTILPTTPKNLTITGKTGTTVSFSWSQSTDNSKVLGYSLWIRTLNSKSWSSYGTTNLSMTIGYSVNTDYEIKVCSFDDSYNKSPLSESVFISTNLVDSIPPTQPTNLRLTVSTTTTASLLWNPSGDNIRVVGYRIWYKPEGGTYQFINVTSIGHTQTGLQPGTQYSWYVQAFDERGNFSLASNTVTGSTKIIDVNPPTTPINLRVIGTTNNSISIKWDPSSDNVGVTGYKVYYKTDTGIYNSIMIFINYWDHVNLPTGSRWTYYVQSFDFAGNYSVSSSTLIANTTPIDLIAPTQPTNLVVQSTGLSFINLNWNASTDNVGVLGYRVYFRTGTNPYQYLITQSNNFTFTANQAGTIWNFYVVAYDAAGNLSLASNLVSGTTKSPDTTPPTAPSNLRATQITENSITISWNQATDNVGILGYRISSRTGTNTFEWIDTPLLNYKKDNLDPNTLWDFRVQSFDASSNLSPAIGISIRTTKSCDLIINPPINLNVITGLNGRKVVSVSIGWLGNSGQYEITRNIISESNGIFANRSSVVIGTSQTETFIDSNPPQKTQLERAFGKNKYYIQYKIKNLGNCTGSIQSEGSEMILVR